MIISINNDFTFIHIPKNAGSDIRHQLGKLDKYNSEFNCFYEHPNLGKTHSGHLTLQEIKDHYPDQYQEVLNTECFAIVRDPMDRFVSALSQRLREFKGCLAVEITQDKLVEEAKEVLSLIEGKTSEQLPVELIHFRKQVDFIYDKDGNQIVKNLFSIEDIPAAIEWLNKDIGLNIEYKDDQIRQNSTMEIKNPLLNQLISPLLVLLKPLIEKMPTRLIRRIKSLSIKLGIYGKAETKSEIYSNNPEILQRVSSHFMDDVKLYQAVELQAASI